MDKDLKSLTRKELEKLLADVKKALTAAQARDRRNAKKAAEKAAAEFGFSLSELDEDKPQKPASRKAAKPAKKPSKAKYANPENPAEKWTGKGRRPNWFLAQVEKGTKPEQMEL